MTPSYDPFILVHQNEKAHAFDIHVIGLSQNALSLTDILKRIEGTFIALNMKLKVELLGSGWGTAGVRVSGDIHLGAVYDTVSYEFPQMEVMYGRQ